MHFDPVRVEEFLAALRQPARPVGAPLPVGFATYVATYGSEPVHDALKLSPLRIVFAGTTLSQHEQLRVGDTLQVTPVYRGSEARASGSLRFHTLEISYRRADGSLVATERSTVVERPS